MGIAEILVYVCSIICLTIYISFAKRNSYQKGFSDGVKHYSDMVDEVLHDVNRFNRESEENGMDLRAYLESIKPLDKGVEE